jgi:predicted metal-dependent HD superfamily phosphohydrolase
MLENSFRLLLKNYTDDGTIIDRYWSEINTCYTEPHRHYHTLSHLNNLLKELTGIRDELENWMAILFALYYHDIIYNPLRSDNEERSAILAREGMEQIAIPEVTIRETVDCIMATRSHEVSDNPDINYFTDADLSVLGQAPDIYKRYSNDIRKEYDIYPGVVYYPARKNVLLDFLQMGRIFKTDFFYNKYEEQARVNIKAEIALIDNSSPL